MAQVLRSHTYRNGGWGRQTARLLADGDHWLVYNGWSDPMYERTLEDAEATFARVVEFVGSAVSA